MSLTHTDLRDIHARALFIASSVTVPDKARFAAVEIMCKIEDVIGQIWISEDVRVLRQKILDTQQKKETE